MAAYVTPDVGGNGHGPKTGLRLWRAEGDGTVRTFHERGPDRDRLALPVEVITAEGDQFAVAQAGKRGKKNESPKAVRHAGRDLKDLLDRGDRAFGRAFNASACNAAGIPA